jgi:hypothetical protein
VPAPFTKTVRGVEVPTLHLTPEETARLDELSERRERNFDPPLAPDWRD